MYKRPLSTQAYLVGLTLPYFKRTRIYFALLLCCLVSLSSCTNALDNTTTQNTVSSSSSVTTRSVSARPEENATEDVLRARLTKIQQMIQHMTLEQKIGQLLIVEYFGSDYQSTVLPYMISQQFVGGYLYQPINHNFDGAMGTISNVKALATQANTDAKIPLLIAIDQEGGVVSKIDSFYGPQPSAQALTLTSDPTVALKEGQQTARNLQSLGINTNFAPVVDVQTVAAQDHPLLGAPDTGDRMFGKDAQIVATYAGAFLSGLQSNRVIGCLKHFPGLGSLHDYEDPHSGLPVVARNQTDLQNIDLAPYKIMIQSNHPAMIMATDVITQAIDPNLPAELSPKAINGVLRGNLGYNGVVVTDGLYMEGITKHWSLSEASVLSIIAGDDLVEGPFTPQQVAGIVQAFKEALQNGRLIEERINQSLQRILLLKMQYGIFS